MPDLKLSDFLIIVATCAGPILAVQAQKWVERWRANQDRKDMIFRTLMATRTMILSQDHVRALNGIELAFYSEAKGNVPKAGSAAAVVEAWRTYFDHLVGPKHEAGSPEDQRFIERSTDLRCALLGAMAKHLKYDITERDIKRGAYYPQFYIDVEKDSHDIRQGLTRLLRGQATVPISIAGLPEASKIFARVFSEDDPELAAKVEQAIRDLEKESRIKENMDSDDWLEGQVRPTKRTSK